jgi:ABC-type polysaccharide/polyol phosphate export permease
MRDDIMFREMALELARYRGLLGMLAWRDVRVRYKQSLLGVSWAFLVPLINTSVLYVIFRFGPIRIDQTHTNGMDYFLFVLIGVLGWGLFAGAINSGTESLTRNSRLVTKIYFPREVFPLASLAGSLVDFGIACVVMAPFYLYFAVVGNVRVSWLLALLPAVLLIQLCFIAGLAMILSMGNLFFRDVKYITTFVLQIWFFATNVVYPIRFQGHPELQWLAAINPMIPILDAYRDILQGRAIENVGGLFLAAGIAVAVLLFGWRVFHKAEFKFAEYV